MDRDDFLRSLNAACAGLSRFFRGGSQQWLVKTLAGQSDTASGGTLDADRVYEILCCFAILRVLQGRVANLRLVRGSGRCGYRFPYAPGNKDSFAFFRFDFGGVTYDLCFGTGIPNPGEADEHPDISLQQKDGAPKDDDRIPGRPVAFWDGKYHRGNAGKADIAQMNLWCDIFPLVRYAKGDVLDRLMEVPFKVSAIVTNAEDGHVNKRQMLKRRFSMVLGFRGDPTGLDATPTRAEHETQGPV